MNNKNFWNDGISIKDFEKILLGFLLLVSVFIGVYKYIKTGDITQNWCNVIFILGGLFTVRKVFSYFKNDNYNKNINFDNNDLGGSI